MNEVGSLFTESAPPVDADQARRILHDFYGLHGEPEPLPSERDHNFRIRARGGDGFVLKITHPAEPRSVTNFQTMALRHIATVDPTLAVPAVIAARDGRFEPELTGCGPPRTVRLLSYLPGQLLIRAPRSHAQDRALGAFLARLGRALRGFFHPAAGQADILWDLRQLPQVNDFVPEIAEPRRRALVEQVMSSAVSEVLPTLPKLRAQVVHNDFNPSNVVVSEANPAIVAGILDFGDMLHAPLACDIAIGASYRWPQDDDPLAGAARFVAGYHSVTPLAEDEVAILLDLIRIRLALAVTIVNWQATRYPEKYDYLMRMNAEVWSFLERLAGLSSSAARDRFRAEIEGQGR
jgi:Ser/Thr protein kinase RdoA (MazF antagonist)